MSIILEAAFMQDSLPLIQAGSFLGFKHLGVSFLGQITLSFLHIGMFLSLVLNAHLQLQFSKSFLQALKIPLNLLQRFFVKQELELERFSPSILIEIKEEEIEQTTASGSIENSLSQTAVQVPRKSLHAGVPLPAGQLALPPWQEGVKPTPHLSHVALNVPVEPDVEPDVDELVEEVELQLS